MTSDRFSTTWHSIEELKLLDAFTGRDQPHAVPLAWYHRPGLRQRTRLVSRLFGIGPRAALHRVARRLATSAERGRTAGDDQLDGDRTRRLLPPPMFADPAAYLLARRSTTGFFDFEDRQTLVDEARRSIPDEVARTIRQADTILGCGVKLLGKRFRTDADDFDWLADPDHGNVWPLSVLDESDAVRQSDADVKFVWEVNRHQFLVTLARAFAYTGDERYARSCVGLVRDWIAQNPAPLGVNWASPLEIAMRSLSWIWALHFLVGSQSLDTQSARRWLVSLRQHRDRLAQRLSTYTDPTNHLIGEVCGLAAITLWLPEWDGSATLQRRAMKILAREIKAQVADDGLDREHATSYQRYVMDLVLQVVALAERNDAMLPASIRSRAEAMLDATVALCGDGARAPRIGDSDDARGVPFFASDLWDFGDLISMAGAVLGRDVPTTIGEAALWIGGDRSGDTKKTSSGVAHRTESTLLPSGYAILYEGAGGGSNRLVFDCGPFGFAPHASHAHAGMLGVVVNVGGEEILVDPGTYAYHDPRGRRDLFRATRSHNTIEIGRRDQADAFDPFKWIGIPGSGVQTASLNQGLDYVEAWHDGYRRLRPAVRHRRGILGINGGWLVIDWLDGQGRQEIARWLHAAPGVAVQRMRQTEQGAPGRLRLQAPGGNALIVQDLGGGHANPAPEIGLAPYSETYGQLTEAAALCFREEARLPAIRLTLLAPERPSRNLKVSESAGGPSTGTWTYRLVEADGTMLRVELRLPDGSGTPGNDSLIITRGEATDATVLRPRGN